MGLRDHHHQIPHTYYANNLTYKIFIGDRSGQGVLTAAMEREKGPGLSVEPNLASWGPNLASEGPNLALEGPNLAPEWRNLAKRTAWEGAGMKTFKTTLTFL